VADFERILSAPIVNLEQLKQLAWDGVPEGTVVVIGSVPQQGLENSAKVHAHK